MTNKDAGTLLAELEQLYGELETLDIQKQANRVSFVSPSDRMVLKTIDDEYRNRLDALNLWLEQQRSTIITDAIKQKQAERELSLAQKGMEITNQIAEKEKEVKNSIIALGSSVKGARFHAIFSKGTAKWDNKKLEGFALVHPEVLNCREPLVPTCTLRKISAKGE